MRRVRVAACQLNLAVGAISTNFLKIASAMDSCIQLGVDIAVFPELAITGYPPEDLLLRPGFVEDNLEALKELTQRSKSMISVVGFVDRREDLYNAAAVMCNEKVQAVYHKRLLPNYSVFDEQRYFRPGRDTPSLCEVNEIRFGVSICEDAWSPFGPIHSLAAGGADFVININASPFASHKQTERERMLSVRAQDESVALLYVNSVGGQDELVFDGGSMLFDQKGDTIASWARFDELIGYYDLYLGDRFHKRLVDPRAAGEPIAPLEVIKLFSNKGLATPALTPSAVLRALELHGPLSPDSQALDTMLSDYGVGSDRGVDESIEEIYLALVLGTRDYVEKNGFSEVLVALSGGIDSSLVVTIATDALGADRVRAVGLPSRYSSDHSITDAELLCDNLGVSYSRYSIEDALVPLSQIASELVSSTIEGLTEENLQSRIRGLLMMAISNADGALVLTTSNKSELATGYSTLYGDTAGGFAVIKDVVKTQVYDLCRFRNSLAGFGVIPLSVLQKAPSAELRPNQKDEDSLPPYGVLDPLLHLYVDLDMTAQEIIEEGFEKEIVARVVRLVDLAEYKRRQSPPGVRLTAKAFGKDRRMPITNGYRPS